MDIHKPRPWHGVREFLKEYLIIVVGVLTALGAEALVETLHWRHQIEVAHEALRYDMKRVTAWGAMVDAQAPCIGSRLAELDAVLDKAQESGRLPPLGPLPRPREGSWAMRAWSGLTYGQTLAHMPNAEQTRLAALALTVQSLNDRNVQQADNWSRLARMSGPGRRTNDAEIAALRETIAQERGMAFNLRRGATNAVTLVVQTGLLSKTEVDKAWKQGLDDGVQAAVCAPLPPPSQVARIWERLMRPVTPPGAARLDDVGVRGESLR